MRGQGAAAAGPVGPRPSRAPPPPHTPTPARAGRAARPTPALAGPPARPPTVAARGRPPGPRVLSPRHPGAGPSHPFILCPGPGAGRRIPGLT